MVRFDAGTDVAGLHLILMSEVRENEIPRHFDKGVMTSVPSLEQAEDPARS